tara:strand:+ start:4554 stop:5168 length:615 start_codon:yes stop_codon:yes gene_type:complete
MAKVTFESIIPEILPSVPECTDLIITRAVRRAAEEFLSKSLIWRVDLEDHFVIAGLADVELETPSSDLRIVQIKKATIDAKDIPQIADAQMPENATQTFCSLVDFNNSLRLTPTPIIAAALSLRVVLSTTSKSTGIDSVVEQEIHEHLIDGALARLYTMQGMPWANNALAGFHADVFTAAVLEARGRAENNSGRAVRKVSYGGL